MGETGRKCLSEICVRKSSQKLLKQTPMRHLILCYQNGLFIFHQSHLIIPHDNLQYCTHSEKHCKFLLINLFKPECIDISCLFFRPCSAELCYGLWSLETNFLSIWGGASGFYIPHLDLWFMPVPFTKVMDFGSHWYPRNLVVDTLQIVVEWVNKVSLWFEYLN